ncbi:CsgG/HfaB family protein [bacterium endosymbiont of Bathymodiolus sp. 5 South]|jgi:curli biogenesis system outer membrane secretion channel CsgG|uniref:CsgG/HfaB family protein n=1 Tax=bacterium endosymbiont of Bathymodiolus sp. 5 South TaxID=1181670 RepID=UPI0010AFC5D4|nr:CsgG/HfaB family protein [bacterium endosymbiont of Bathymodiolus sp. 5 South]CAC9454204.1 putative lipoprotein [uncultured Gammaproteobacteria bacterium]CAC9643334.1 putative lipoprotein [uncultured Gammaproteobacteria bacterium]SHN92566.1 putative lipoprotein [bacterium endosymbiont of Bathymodiolus sp. 5 South]SSC08050.1 Probable lipoprotein [bacterium endosymbiont of Bathymodiolus sp. 5 South]VVH59092.1 Probable lipoprotein [uncultured Gammaproteobacteria bacterium]
MKNKNIVIALLMFSSLMACTPKETHNIVKETHVNAYQQPYSGKRVDVIIGSFENNSDYMRGLFTAGSDKLGNQANTILKTHLQQSNRFNVMDRQNMKSNMQEAKFMGAKQNIKGAHYVVTGSVTEFGRKVTGSRMLGGILGSSKQQTAYSKVSLNIVDVLTSQVVYSVQGAGEYTLSHEELLGFGGSSGYDATLNGKVLNLSIMEAINNMTRDMQNNVWKIEK